MQVGNFNENFFNNNIPRGRGRGRAMRRGGRLNRGNVKKFRGNNRVNNFNNGQQDLQPTNNPPPHYEESSEWSFPKEDINMGNQQVSINMGNQQVSTSKKPLIVTKGLPSLGSSFVQQEAGLVNNFNPMAPPNMNISPANMENGSVQVSEENDQNESKAAWSMLQEFWTFVQENPYNFDGWIQLLNYVESMKHIDAARSAFEGFLPLYPYCFAYWKKLADIEQNFSSLQKSIGVLIYGTRSIPLCHEIWTALLSSFKQYCIQENHSLDLVRMLYKTGLEKIGMTWNSSPFWEACIKFEKENGDLLKVMTLYKWLISIPVKVYNKHWDMLVVMIRDEHPQKLLPADTFDHYHKLCCDQLKVKYSQLTYDPENPPKVDKQVSMLIKEKILAGLIKIHENNVKQAEKRWKLEEKIKRPYFHVKPLEKKQLKAWNDLIDFEIKEGDPVKIMLLFERCLVACAQYEEMWCRYASFLEEHAGNISEGKYKDLIYRPLLFSGDKDSENLYKSDWFDFYCDVSDETKTKAAEAIERLSENVGVGSRVLTCPILTPQWILHGVTYEDVRQVYRRSSWIHCPSKPLILMQWAEFEESQGDVQTARELLNTVLSKHPNVLKGRMQLIELERRNGNLERVEELFSEAFTTFTETKQKSFVAIRFARFLFKVKGESATPLAILRKVIKKDKGNVYLYNQVFSICYEKQPVDCVGVLAAVMLALASKELSLEQKYEFCVQRKEFLNEHGTIQQIKKAEIEMREVKAKLDEERKEMERLENEMKKKEEEFKAAQEKAHKKAQEEADMMELGELPDMDDTEILRDDLMKDSSRSEGLKRLDNRNEEQLSRSVMRRWQQGLDDGRGKSSKDRESRKSKSHRSSSPRKRHRKRKRSHERREEHSRHKSKEPIAEYGEYTEIPSNFEDMQQKVDPVNVREMPTIETKISDFLNMAHMEANPKWTQSPNGRQAHMDAKPKLIQDDMHSIQPETNISGMFAGGPPLMRVNDQNSNINRPGHMNKENFGNKHHPINDSKPDSVLKKGSVNGIQNGPPSKDSFGGSAGQAPDANVGPLMRFPIPNSGPGILGPAGTPARFMHPPPGHMNKKNFGNKPHAINDSTPDSGLKKGSVYGIQNGPPSKDSFGGSAGQAPDANIRPLMSFPISNSGPGIIEPAGAPARFMRPPPGHMNKKNFGNKHLATNDTKPDSGLKKGSVNGIQNVSPSKDSFGGSAGQAPAANIRPLMSFPIPNSGPGILGPAATPRFMRPPVNRPKTIVNPNIMAPSNVNLSSPVINVPDWLVTEGGELRLSQGSNGDSVLKYWPKFMNEKGHNTLFGSLSKSIKWLTRQTMSGSGQMTDLPMRLSWLGPCDYNKDGYTLNTNNNWPPEIINLLHILTRVCDMTTQFNSCLLRLLRDGRDHQPWDSEEHPAMNKNPKVAIVSVGAIRSFEMKHKNGPEFIRFPLLPGSLLFFEGATQNDWIQRITEDPKVKGERISMSFRTMLMINGLTV